MLVRVFQGTQIALPGEVAPGLHLTWQAEAEGFTSDVSLAEAVFAALNQADRPTAHTSYSLSVGDLVVVEDRGYRVADFGFGLYDAALTQELLRTAPPVPSEPDRITPAGVIRTKLHHSSAPCPGTAQG